METTKHTPGPWNIGGKMNPGTINERVWVWGPTQAGKQSGEIVAENVTATNARLIAAAPELERVAALLVEFADRNTRINLDGKLGAAVVAARAALAKAKVE